MLPEVHASHILNASSGNVNFNLAIEDRQAAVASKARTMTTLIEARKTRAVR